MKILAKFHRRSHVAFPLQGKELVVKIDNDYLFSDAILRAEVLRIDVVRGDSFGDFPLYLTNRINVFADIRSFDGKIGEEMWENLISIGVIESCNPQTLALILEVVGKRRQVLAEYHKVMKECGCMKTPALDYQESEYIYRIPGIPPELLSFEL